MPAFRALREGSRLLFVAAVLCGLLGYSGCTENDSATVAIQDNPGGDDPVPPYPPSGEVEFVHPADGSTVTAPTVLSVAGSAVRSVRFEVDGTLIFEDTITPFAWSLNPDSFPDGQHEIAVGAEITGGTERVIFNIILAAPAVGADQPPEVFKAVEDLLPGHWYEIPNTRMDHVAPNPRPGGALRAIMEAWSGGAYDSKRNRLLVWGGGRGSYGGNEIYAFDMDDLKWIRLTDPSPHPEVFEFQARVHADGAPISRHSGESLEYLPDPVDRFVVVGDWGVWPAGGFSLSGFYHFDVETKRWTSKAEFGFQSINAPTTAVGHDGKLWMLGGSNPILASYDAANDEWTSHGKIRGESWTHGRAGEIDPLGRKYFAIGRGAAYYFDLNDPNADAVKTPSTGDKEIEDQLAPGFTYHSGEKKLVAWAGGADVFVFDPKTFGWKKIETTGSVSPGPAQEWGTYGRFRYSASRDLLVVVSFVDRNVFVYRLPQS